MAAMKASNHARPPVEKQGNAHANGLFAQRQLGVGHLEAACSTWHEFLDDYAALSYARADEHFDTMRRRTPVPRQSEGAGTERAGAGACSSQGRGLATRTELIEFRITSYGLIITAGSAYPVEAAVDIVQRPCRSPQLAGRRIRPP